MGRACTAQEYVAGSGQRWPKKDASLVGEIDHGNSIVTNKLDDTCLNSINYSFVQQNWDGHYLCDRLRSKTRDILPVSLKIILARKQCEYVENVIQNMSEVFRVF